MKLALDVMGFENDPNEAIQAARDFVSNHNDVSVILFGNENIIKPKLLTPNEFEIVHCSDIIHMDDTPITALRKNETSMYKAIKSAADGITDGVLSAGSTACYVLLVYGLIRTIPGINKPAFMPYVPTSNGKGLILLDVGANKECSGKDLYQFAQMAKIYCETIRGINNPKIGVINIGSEKEKGFAYHHEANNLLKADNSLNYVGFIETRELLNGIVDIAVCDGYTGNITLKASEGALKTVTNSLKVQYKKPWNWLGALFSIFAIKGVKKTFDYKNNAGALVIGLNKIAVKTHGNADYQQFYSSLSMLYRSVKNNVIDKIKENLK